jgi:hypothetical protein
MTLYTPIIATVKRWLPKGSLPFADPDLLSCTDWVFLHLYRQCQDIFSRNAPRDQRRCL